MTDKLVEEGLKTKISAIIYLNTMHPPIRTKIRNQKNIMLTFCLITRSFYEPFRRNTK